MGGFEVPAGGTAQKFLEEQERLRREVLERAAEAQREAGKQRQRQKEGEK